MNHAEYAEHAERAGKNRVGMLRDFTDLRRDFGGMPTTGDDRFYLYFKASPDQWYFFGYQSGVLNVVSNNTRFMDVLLGMKTKETQTKMPDGETYEIIAANPSTAEAFINRVRSGRTKE